MQVYPAWKGGGTVLCSILGDDLRPALPATVQKVQNIICPPEDGGSVPSADGYGIGTDRRGRDDHNRHSVDFKYYM